MNMGFVSDKVKEACEQILILSLYAISVPFYMMGFTYLLTLYQGRISFMSWELTPLFLGTVWIPAFVGLFLNDFFRKIKSRQLAPNGKIKNYPFIFIFCFSIYFLILGFFSFGTDCLAISLSGILLVLFSFLLRPIKRSVEYLPTTELFYFYAVLFLYPILVLMANDIYSVVQGSVGFSILLAPISYIAGISGLAIVCLGVRYYSFYRHISLKKNLLTMNQVVGLLVFFDVLASIYLIPFVGNQLFVVCFVMSILLYSIEYLFTKVRFLRRQKEKRIV